ncbi:DEAD/DEAH box helicase [Lacticaseibacillus paracasei]|uniref:DEAD/DEAH box helicase n=1 Tax=Lacticaseibacillus paracasei TaxID=1597 RepID=UPI00101738B3|nr:DEAD/DEAH box helicase [Lacticaseibacillus paracasei]QBA73965.1 DEAD/DEAH box helicase [Lacticaseibacillus paracasei]
MTIATPFQKRWQAAGYTEQTPIQTAVYQPLKADEDVVGLAPTGSGKTLAFGLPLLEKMVPGDGLQLLILAPSQELAIQTRDVLTPYAKDIGITVQGVIGSANVKRQLDRLKEKPEVIVATAGRLLELIQSRKLKLDGLQTLVVDEADEMLRDPGFDQVREIAAAAPAEAQLAFFSATPSPYFKELHKWFGKTPDIIDVRAIDRTRGEVRHLFLQTDRAHQVDWLRTLAHTDGFKALVFFNQNSSLERVAGILRHQAVRFAVLSREGRQTVRQKALTDFRRGRITLLLVTDMAGRGLDIPKLPAAVNFEPPKRAEVYIHRAGRTGRMGEAGLVVTLGDDHDRRDLSKLVPQYHIHRGYMSEGKLVDTPPAKKVSEASAPTTVEKPASPVAKQQPVKPEVAQEPAVRPRRKHKKHRLRDQRNKGKHKDNA